MVMGYIHLKEFLRRSAGLEIDKSDVERLTDLIGRKLNDLLVIGVRNASYNNRDIIMESDLPLNKGILEDLKDFRRPWSAQREIIFPIRRERALSTKMSELLIREDA